MERLIPIVKNALFYKTAALVLAGSVLVLATDHVAQFTQFNWLTDHAEELVDETLTKDGVTFLSLSGIKAVVSLLEGSSVGVGFQLEIGDLVQPAYDYVDFVWKLFLYATVVLGFYKLILESDILNIGFYLAGAGCFIWAISPAAKRWRPFFGAIGKRFVLMGILLTLIVPVSLIGTHHISAVYLTKIKEENAERLATVNWQFEKTRNEFIMLKSKISVLSPSESIDEISSSMTRIMESTSQATATGAKAGLYYTLILICESLVLPFLAAYILYKVVALALGFGLTRPNPPPAESDSEEPDTTATA